MKYKRSRAAGESLSHVSTSHGALVVVVPSVSRSHKLIHAAPMTVMTLAQEGLLRRSRNRLLADHAHEFLLLY